MGMHEKVELTFKGETFTVESDRVMGLIETVESVITLDELVQSEKPRPALLSRAYCSALKYAGASVNQGEVYASMFSESDTGGILETINTLLMLMIPPDFITQKQEPEEAPKKKKTRKKKGS